MKPVNVDSNIYINPKFAVGAHVRISKYKNIFANDYIPNWSKEGFVIRKLKTLLRWYM